GIASQAGLSIEELGAAVATSLATAKPEEAITNLAGFIKAIIAPAQSAQAAAEQLGIRFDAVGLSSRGLAGFLDVLRNRLGITAHKELIELIQSGADTDRIFARMKETGQGLSVELLTQLFPSVEGLRGALALMAGDGAEFKKNLDDMNASAGATAQGLAIMSDTPQDKLNKLKTLLNDLGIEIGTQLLPFVEQLAPKIRETVQAVVQWIHENPQLAAQIAEWVVKLVVLSPLLIGLGGLLAGLGGAVTLLTGSISLIVTVFGLLLTPVGAVIAIFGVLIGAMFALVDDWGEFARFLAEPWVALWDGIKHVASSTWDWITGTIHSFLDFVSSAWEFTWGRVRDTFFAVWNGIKNFFGPIIAWLVEKFQLLWGWVQDIAAAVGGSISDAWQTLRSWLGFAEGGWVIGPGGVDNVPARLSAGEFVVEPRAASMFGPLLEWMNAQGHGGAAPASAGGLSQSFGDINFDLRGAGDPRTLAHLISVQIDRLKAKGTQATNRRGLR
ncbi:MAG: phage tail tape measure protein, partial [Salinibacterium sp.]